jgi:hypothetical protein
MGVFSDEIPVCGVQYVGLLHPKPSSTYKIDLTGGSDQVHLSVLPDSEWLVLEY